MHELEVAEWDADVFIIGSDQVWNSQHSNGKDPANYLSFVPLERKKISYAASFGINYVVSKYQNQVKNLLSKFQLLTVREKQGVSILESFGLKSFQVVDPVFLFTKDEWSLIAKEPDAKEDYILVYDFGNNVLMKDFVCTYAKKYKLKIYSLNDFVPHRYADENINNAGPEEFLGLIKNAKCFVSNSFHGTAFSILFEIPFFVFNRKDAVNSRMDSLLEIVGLQERIIYNRNEFDKMNLKINFQEVKCLLAKQISFSKNILLKNLL